MLGEIRPLPRQKTYPGETLLGLDTPRVLFPHCPVHCAKLVHSLHTLSSHSPLLTSSMSYAGYILTP